jgi:uncharacterized repeat protein (TIGR03803 family)
MAGFNGCCSKNIAAYAFALAMVIAAGADAAQLNVLHSFTGGSDGSYPFNGPVVDSVGRVFGITTEGGGKGCSPYGCGAIYEIAAGGTYSVVYAFSGSDGSYPLGRPIEDAKGNIYGTTYGGGAYNAGTVFKFTPRGSLKLRYAFTGKTDGDDPDSGVIQDEAGNLYGSTHIGGNLSRCSGGSTRGCGVVFKISPNGTETVLHAFIDSDGAWPLGQLARDKSGNLFGVTTDGTSTGYGGVYRIAPDGTFTLLHGFVRGKTDGTFPGGGLIFGANGNLYGTLSEGGKWDAGVIYEITPKGKERVLFSFNDSKAIGGDPVAPLMPGRHGAFYGETRVNDLDEVIETIFRMSRSGSVSVLASFKQAGCASPEGGLAKGPDGSLYGICGADGAGGEGAVFVLEK